MSEHTNTTERMTKRLVERLEQWKNGYHVVLAISPPKNHDKTALEDITWRFQNVVNFAKRKRFNITYAIDPTPQKPVNYNCVGCRKRKTGDYFWVEARLKPKKKDNYSSGWNQPMAKVCSKDCGEMMILRLA